MRTIVTSSQFPAGAINSLRKCAQFPRKKFWWLKAIRDRVKQAAGDGRYELYKVSLRYDNPVARMAHGFPLDEQSVEVKEMLKATENTGFPFPDVKQQQQ